VVGALVATVLALAHTAPALAQNAEADRAAAGEAYQNGQARYHQRDYEGAANWFEMADRLAPASLAIQNAIHAHNAAGGAEHAARAATLALRLQSRYPDDPNSVELARTTLARLASDLARVTVACGQCTVEIDGHVQSGAEVFVAPGHHTVTARFHDRGTGRQEFDAEAGSTQTITIAEPEGPTPGTTITPEGGGNGAAGSSGETGSHDGEVAHPRNEGPRVLSPAFFVVGAVLTVGLGVGAALSWVDATHLGSDLITMASMTHMPNPALESQTNGAELRTTVLDVATGVVGAATLVTGVFFTRWTSPRRERASLTPWVARGVAGLGVGGTF
jgi:hypothetical protein